MNALILALALAAGGPEPCAVVQRCDTLEINHVYDKQGQLVFTQFVFWKDTHVLAWRNLRDKTKFHLTEEQLTFMDQGVLRQLKFRNWRPSWTQYDVELEQRNRRRRDERIGLFKENNDAYPAPAELMELPADGGGNGLRHIP